MTICLGIELPCNASPEVIYFIPPSLWGSTFWSATIHGPPVCYLGCPSIVSKSTYVTSPSPFFGFNDVRDVTNLGFDPYPLVCPMILPGHTNHCPLHISLSSCYAPPQGFVCLFVPYSMNHTSSWLLQLYTLDDSYLRVTLLLIFGRHWQSNAVLTESAITCSAQRT